MKEIMTINIKATFLPICFSLILMVSCNISNLEEHIFYDSGELKESKYYISKNDTGTYSLMSYYRSGKLKSQEEFVSGQPTEYHSYFDNGKPFEENYFLHGKIHGVTKVFNEYGDLNAEYFYLNGVPSVYLKNDFANNHLSRTTAFKIVEDVGEEIGQLVFSDQDRIDKESSFFYTIRMSDTLKKNSESTVCIEAFNNCMPNWMMNLTFSDADGCFKFPNDSSIYKRQVDSLSYSFTLKPIKSGVTHLIGYIWIKDSLSTKEFQFPIMKTIYIE